jgi:hypothetical protein
MTEANHKQNAFVYISYMLERHAASYLEYKNNCCIVNFMTAPHQWMEDGNT